VNTLVDYFKDCKTILDIFNKEIKVEEKIHDCMPKYVKNILDSDAFALTKEHILRQKFIEIGMFGFVSWKWINPLAEWIGKRKCLEVMAGRGWLSYALRQKGVDIIATDNFSWANSDYPKWKETVTEVENIDAVEAVKKYGKDVNIIIMSWAYMDNTAFQVLKTMNEVNPDALMIYIGEGKGQSTADDMFYEHFQLVYDEVFYREVHQNYERWEGWYDRIYLGKYSDSCVSID
jgi:hypothetical protein